MSKKELNRWDFSKQRSNYHFDNFKNEDSNPPFKVLGHIKGDLVSEFNKLLASENTTANTFLNRLKLYTDGNQKPFTFDYDVQELNELGLPLDYSFFSILQIKNSPFFQDVKHSFGMKEPRASIHIQKPGQIFPYHVDEIPELKDNQAEHWLDQRPEEAARVEIQIFDWTPGHIWTYGNTYWKQWRSGEIAYHEWRHIPHGTANISRSIRASLQVTGFVTDKMKDIIANGYK